MSLNADYLNQCDSDLRLSSTWNEKRTLHEHDPARLARIDQISALLAENFDDAGLDRSQAAVAGMILLSVAQRWAENVESGADAMGLDGVREFRLAIIDFVP